MPTYGFYQRAQPRVRVRKGYPGNEPTTITFSAPVTNAVTIYSGQVISLTNGAWVLGCPKGQVPYIAFQDSSDTDVLSSGLLLGLSCAGRFIIETGYYTVAAGNYLANDIPLKADAVTAGNVTLAASLNTGTANVDLLGMTIMGGQQVVLGQQTIGTTTVVVGTNSEAAPTGSPPQVTTLVFITNWSPSRA